MSTGPLISIVVPFYDAARFLEDAVESVFGQTYPNWELLLVDDGSTDGSTGIARRYAATHDAVRYLAHAGHANRGISASRNLGRRYARGTWVACLDADDVWFPSKLAEQVALADAHPEAGMIIGATEYWYGWTGVPEDQARDAVILLGGPQNSLVRPPQLLEWLYPLGRGTAPCPAVFFVRADVVEAVGGWEEHADNSYEDQYFLAKVYLAVPVYVSSSCWARYRQHPASTMVADFATGGYDAARQRFLEWFEGYLRERHLVDTPVWRLLQRALWKYRHPRLMRIVRLARRALHVFARRIRRATGERAHGG
jgi:glycosyltransferase involved in cell wall biosynthesis